MKIYFLGTGTSQGIPVIGSNHPVCLSQDPKDKRLRVSIWIKTQDTSIIIDCGPDFRQQMLNSQCDKIDAILFTHEHADHTFGLDDIRPFNYKQGPINVYAHQRVIAALTKRFDYIFCEEEKYPGAPSVHVHEVINNMRMMVNNLEIIPISFFHGSLQVFGYRIDNFAYLTDLKTISLDELDKLKNLEVLVINALRYEPHPSHLNVAEALEIISQIKPKKTYLTHISHLLGFHEEVSKQLPENVFLAHDNLTINL